MKIQLPKRLTDHNMVDSASAAYMMYMFHTFDEMKRILNEKLSERQDTEEDRKAREQLIMISDPADFFKWMRKPLAGVNKWILRDLMLEHEDEITDMILHRIIRSFVDDFVEYSIDFMIDCRENHSKWILENYDRVVNPYTKSLLCLVLGFRGDESCVSFLLEQEMKLSEEYPEERFNQGPIVALYMLAGVNEYLGLNI